MTETRSVFALILAVMILQIAGGLLSMLTPLGLEALGTAPHFIGGIAALYATGFMLGAWTAPAALASFGNIRLFAEEVLPAIQPLSDNEYRGFEPAQAAAE